MDFLVEKDPYHNPIWGERGFLFPFIQKMLYKFYMLPSKIALHDLASGNPKVYNIYFHFILEVE